MRERNRPGRPLEVPPHLQCARRARRQRAIACSTERWQFVELVHPRYVSGARARDCALTPPRHVPRPPTRWRRLIRGRLSPRTHPLPLVGGMGTSSPADVVGEVSGSGDSPPRRQRTSRPNSCSPSPPLTSHHPTSRSRLRRYLSPLPHRHLTSAWWRTRSCSLPCHVPQSGRASPHPRTPPFPSAPPNPTARPLF